MRLVLKGSPVIHKSIVELGYLLDTKYLGRVTTKHNRFNLVKISLQIVSFLRPFKHFSIYVGIGIGLLLVTF